MRRYLSVVVACVAALGVLLVVDSVAGSATPVTSKVATITIKNMKYTGTLTVKPGVSVRVTNADPFSHTATNPRGRFNTGTISPGTSKTITAPKQVGNYAIRCNFHSTMRGTLHVQN